MSLAVQILAALDTLAREERERAELGARLMAEVQVDPDEIALLPREATPSTTSAASPRSAPVELLVGINRWNGQTDPIRLDFDRRTGRYTPARASGHGVAPWENEVPASPPAPSPAGARTTLLEAGLTSSEVEVALLVGQGKTNREIAAARGCADSTVDTHIKRSRDKLGVFDRNALAAFVEGLTQESP